MSQKLRARMGAAQVHGRSEKRPGKRSAPAPDSEVAGGIVAPGSLRHGKGLSSSQRPLRPRDGAQIHYAEVASALFPAVDNSSRKLDHRGTRSQELATGLSG